MADFTLVIFKTEEIREKSGGGLIKSLSAGISSLASELLFKAGILKCGLFTRLFLILKRRYVKETVKRIELTEDVNVWTMVLPFEATRLSCFNSNAVKSFINSFCLEKGAAGCYMPAEAAGYDMYREYRIKRGASKLIYKAHLQYILENIYESGGIRLGALDTVIVAGSDRQELLYTVRRLEPNFKYISVAASEDRYVEAELAGMSAETGLTINISCEYKSLLKSADLIINLAGAAALSKYRMKPGSLVLNFNNNTDVRIQGENTVINGIEYLLPPGMFTGLGTEILRRFSKKELTEAVMEMKLGNCSERPCDSFCIERALEEFKRCGCRITGYVGRRGSLKAESVIRSVRSCRIPKPV